jgi:hypothetical protein
MSRHHFCISAEKRLLAALLWFTLEQKSLGKKFTEIKSNRLQLITASLSISYCRGQKKYISRFSRHSDYNSSITSP